MFTLLEKTFLASGVAERVSATSRTCTSVTFQPQRANSNAVQVAPGSFATGKGFEFAKPATNTQIPEKTFTSPGREGINLYEWYAIGTQGEGLNIIIEEF